MRRVRSSRATTARPAKPAVDPISAIVDDIIAGMNRPLDDQRREMVEQSIGNINQTNRLHDFYDGQTKGIAGEASADFGAMLAHAAKLKGISADTVAKHQDYLRSMMGQSNGGTQDAQVAAAAGATQSDLAATNDAFIKNIEAGGQSLGGVMGQLRVSGRAAQRERNQQELLSRSAGERDLNAQKAANSAQRSQLYRQIQGEERDAQLKARVAEAEWGLKQSQAESLDNYRQGQLTLGQQRNEIAAINATRPSKPTDNRSIYGNLPKKYQQPVKEVFDRVWLKQDDGSHKPVPKPWATSWDLLTDRAGLHTDTAALLATKWFGERAAAKVDPRTMLAMLRDRGVSERAASNIIRRQYGPNGWATASRRRGLGGATDFVGGVIESMNS